MKKNYSTLNIASILLGMLAVFSLSFVSCSDDDNEATDKPFEVIRLKGTLSFDEESQKYIIVPKNVAYPFESTANNGSNVIYISNMTDEYKSMVGDVVFSGIMKKIDRYAHPNVCIIVGYYSIELSELYSAETESRSLSDDSFSFYCPTPTPEPPAWFFTRNFTELHYNTSYNFRVFVHVVRPTSGVVDGYIKENVASAVIDNLNDYYSEANITFSLLGSDYIDDSKYIDMTIAQCNSSNNLGYGIFEEKVQTNAINIYVLSSAPNLKTSEGELFGLANDIPGNACLVKELNYMNATIAHEIGHCLGLYHTHQGTANLYLYNYYDGGTPELVDGSNSSIAGDYIIDTPADPCYWYICTYSGSFTDDNGDSYNPDPENIMSYSRCQSKHTQKQIERIYETIDNSTMLQTLCDKTITNKITTPSVIGSASSYTLSVDAPESYIVTWNVTCRSCTSKTASISYSETLIGRNVTLTNRYPDAVSQRYDIEITVKTYLHDYEFKAYKSLFKISNPATTGTLTWGTETNSGTINLSSPQTSSSIIVRQGESLSFIYTDVCGASSYTDNNVFSYSIYSPSGFTPITGANHMFKCESYATTTNDGKMMLSFTYPGSSTIMQIPLQILKGSTTLSADSIKTEPLELTGKEILQLN